MEKSEQKTKEAIEYLKDVLSPGDTVYAIVKHVAPSGMSRAISFYAIKDNEPKWLDYKICQATYFKFSERYEAVNVGGCGMDMAFHVIYELGSILWPKGDGKYVTGRNGDTLAETDGGYLLKSRRL